MTNKEKVGQDSFDLEYVLSLIKKRWSILLACMILSTGAAFLYNKLKLPVYKVGASVLIRKVKTSLPRLLHRCFREWD